MDENRHFKVELATAFSYIKNYRKVITHDTLYLYVSTTTIANIFNNNREIYFEFELGDNVKYINIANSILPINKLRKCNF